MEGTGARLIFEKLLAHLGETFTLLFGIQEVENVKLSLVDIYGKRIYFTVGTQSFSVFFGMFGSFSDSVNAVNKVPTLRLKSKTSMLSFYKVSSKKAPAFREEMNCEENNIY